MKIKELVFLMFLFCGFYANAQSTINSIRRDIDSFSVLLDTDIDSAFYYIKKAHKKSIAIQNDSLLARTNYNIGYYLHDKKYNKEDSKEYFYKAISYSKKTKFYKIWSYSYNQLGLIATEENKFDKALSYYLYALDIADKNKIYNIKSSILINTGNLYLLQKDTIKAMECYYQNIKNAEKNNFEKELSQGYTTIALLNAKTNSSVALKYYQKALLLAKKAGDDYTEFNIHFNMSDLYLNKDQFNLDKVLYHLQSAKKNQERLKDDTLLFYVNFNFGGYYRNKNQFDEALNHYFKALKISKKGIDSSIIINLYQAISDLYVLKNDYKNAYSYNEKVYFLKDSVFNIDKNKSFTEIQTKYEVDKKNFEIKLLTKEKEIQKNKREITLIIGLVVLSLLLLFIFFLRNRIKLQKEISINEHKLHHQEVVRLEQEQELKRVKGVVEGQEQERNRLSKEIHDGIGASLAGIKLELSQINSELKNGNLDIIEFKMAAAFNELRLISHDLRSNFLKENNLEKRINQLILDWESRKVFKIEFIVFPPNSLNKLGDAVSDNIYRTIQELLVNVSKHAKANNVVINFTRHDNLLNIIFEDDGVGFKEENEKGIGLKNIKERIDSLNGFINIESNNGATIIIDIPILNE
jgi:signal transduction histidine kinase